MSPRLQHGLMLVALVMFGVSSPCLAAEPAPDLDQLLQTFVGELIEIQPGQGRFPATFQMGAAADGTPRQVTLKEPFAVAKYEVPQNLYFAVMGHNPSRWTGPRNSVEMMSWRDAMEFCRRITALLRERKLIAADEAIRLPSEAEWEYCCRAGTATRYSFGDDIRRPNDPPRRNSILDEYAWYTGNAAGNDPPVGALQPNPWGLYDVHGYLWEFTANRWSDMPAADVPNKDLVESAKQWPAETQVVLRGGSWKNPAERLTSDSRRAIAIDAKDDAVGFRCVRSKVSKD